MEETNLEWCRFRSRVLGRRYRLLCIARRRALRWRIYYIVSQHSLERNSK